MNYAANTYPFRQDSSFLYYWGLDHPGLAAVIDIDAGTETMFGNDPTVAEIVWTGPQRLLRDKCEDIGVRNASPMSALEAILKKALDQHRRIHVLPQYRGDNVLGVASLLGIPGSSVGDYISPEFIRAVVAQRSTKTSEEIDQIEIALDMTHAMHMMAMSITKPGLEEREIVGAMEGGVIAMGGQLSFPIIFSIHGETLHNPYHDNILDDGDIVVNDSGAESPMHYAGDITRTIPVSGQFTEPQRDVYRIVLAAQEAALDKIRPGVRFKDVHLEACRTLAEGLKGLGLMKGDTGEAVRQGAHALFFQCGLGHMMGLDVHDMENLGEDYVGYDESTKRDQQFGLCYLRMAKSLQAGYVVTVEPGLYFIPALIDTWKAERKYSSFIDFDAVEKYRDFGGVRIEDDILVTENGYRLLGTAIPKTIEEVESLCSHRSDRNP